MGPKPRKVRFNLQHTDWFQAEIHLHFNNRFLGSHKYLVCERIVYINLVPTYCNLSGPLSCLCLKLQIKYKQSIYQKQIKLKPHIP